jgi:hypothetical protein
MKASYSPRKRIFVSRPIQGQLTLRLGMYWLLYHFVLWHVLFVYHFLQQRLVPTEQVLSFQELYTTFVRHYFPIIICSIAMLPIFLVDLVRLSHRIAGPVVRFRSVLDDMIAGRPVQHIRLRRGDLMMELEEKFNQYIDVYEQERARRSPEATLSEEQAALLAELTQTREAVAPLEEPEPQPHDARLTSTRMSG